MALSSIRHINNIMQAPLKIKRFHTHKSVLLASQDEMKKRQAEMMAKGLPKQKPIDGVKQILLVASGKGGVGKSTTSVNLAVALKALYPDKEVGLLDADVFGPSIPLMMNLEDPPLLDKSNMMIPLVNYGVKCMSMGFLYDKHSPAIWRGLMVMSAIDRLVRQVAWSPLDWLIIDTPPGTGDTHLSLIQTLPISGVLLVTTSQNVALQVARRGAEMFRKLNVPLVGLVNNMAAIQCPQCGHDVPVFGSHTRGTASLAADLDLELLQDIPLSSEITDGSDSGKPVVLTYPQSPQTTAYKNLAEKVSIFLNSQSKPS